MSAISTLHRKLLLPGISFLIFLSSCKNKDDSSTIMDLEEGLINSNKSINLSSELTFNALYNKLNDPITHSKAQIWFPRAQKIQLLSKELFDYIEALKKDRNIGNDKINSLYERLQKYKNDVLNTDSTIREFFSDNLILTSKTFAELKLNKEEFNKKFFYHISKEATVAILTKFQNNIKIIEKNLLIFCNEHITYHGWRDNEFFVPLVSIDKSVVMGGKEITITAGIGQFSRIGNPQITISGKNIPLNETGVSVYSFKASDKTGDHYLPIKISYTDQDGQNMWVEKNIKYTVVNPCDQ